MVTKQDTFYSLARIAKQTKDAQDIKIAMRYGIENRIALNKVREALSF